MHASRKILEALSTENLLFVPEIPLNSIRVGLLIVQTALFH